jgi:hypothetical protein
VVLTPKFERLCMQRNLKRHVQFKPRSCHGNPRRWRCSIRQPRTDLIWPCSRARSGPETLPWTACHSGRLIRRVITPVCQPTDHSPALLSALDSLRSILIPGLLILSWCSPGLSSLNFLLLCSFVVGRLHCQ